MTSEEAIKRARSHQWIELNDQTEGCAKCKLVLGKDVNLEDVPGCSGLTVTGPWRLN